MNHLRVVGEHLARRPGFTSRDGWKKNGKFGRMVPTLQADLSVDSSDAPKTSSPGRWRPVCSARNPAWGSAAKLKGILGIPSCGGPGPKLRGLLGT